ncbi:MAG: diphosphomevalonate decarboxylase [Candidatus Micrarchaeia archaeon]
MNISTAVANANIAIIKYWGNRNNKLILPANSSLSFTMDEKLQTKTTLIFDESFGLDELWINDEKSGPNETKRVSSFIDVFRKLAETKMKAKVFSENSFPKGAGLASSASAFAALSHATSNALDLDLNSKQLSLLARFGSGSASRSVFGGAVEWNSGIKPDGSDCFSKQLLSEKKLKDLRNVIGIVEKSEKKVGSREGMSITASTSKLYKKRLAEVSKRLENAKRHVLNFNFQKLAPIIMEESNNMHLVMGDSIPPLVYLNSTSKKIIKEIENLNKENDFYLGAYTFDAGPNAHIYTTKKYAKIISSLLKDIPGIEEVLECHIGKGVMPSKHHLM